MFSKYPLVLPFIAIVILLMLFIFQKQQLKKAETLRAQARTAMPQLVKVVDDPLEAAPKGRPFRCAPDKVAYGVAYPLTANIGTGRVSFDLLAFNQSVKDEMLFFAVTGDSNAACMPALLKTSAINLYFNTKNDSLYLTANQSAVAWRLDSELALPIRFQVEWFNGTATLFVNGSETARVKYAGNFPQGEYRLLLGQALAAKDKIGADFKALQAALAP